MKTLHIPPYLKSYAHDLAIIRIKDNKDRYKDTHKHRPGYKKSLLLGSVSREYRMCSRSTIEHVLCYYRKCSLTKECVLLLAGAGGQRVNRRYAGCGFPGNQH